MWSGKGSWTKIPSTPSSLLSSPMIVMSSSSVTVFARFLVTLVMPTYSAAYNKSTQKMFDWWISQLISQSLPVVYDCYLHFVVHISATGGIIADENCCELRRSTSFFSHPLLDLLTKLIFDVFGNLLAVDDLSICVRAERIKKVNKTFEVSLCSGSSKRRMRTSSRGIFAWNNQGAKAVLAAGVCESHDWWLALLEILSHGSLHFDLLS